MIAPLTSCTSGASNSSSRAAIQISGLPLAQLA